MTFANPNSSFMKRPCSFPEATDTELEDQSVLSDSRENGVRKITFGRFATKAELDSLSDDVDLKANKTYVDDAITSVNAKADKNVFKFLKGYSTLNNLRDALTKGKAILMPTYEDDGTGRNDYKELYFLRQEGDYVWCFFHVEGNKSYEVKIDFTNSGVNPTITETLTELATKTEVQGKLSAVSHDATLEGDGTEANPLKVIGGGGSSTIFSVDGEKLLIQNNVRVEQELLIV